MSRLMSKNGALVCSVDASVDSLLDGIRTECKEGRSDAELELGGVFDVVLVCVPG